MPGVTDLWLFLVAGVMLNITPGPDMTYVMARGVHGGWPQGAAAALGIGAGCFVHILLGAVGLSAILATSATAFTILKLAGAAYLVWMGAKMLIASAGSGDATALQPKPSSTRAVFVEGFVINALNPKVALFFLALLPQFIAADAPSKSLAFVVLGLVFNTTGTAWNLLVAWSAARSTRVFSAGTTVRRWLDRALGALFIGLGIRLALAERR